MLHWTMYAPSDLNCAGSSESMSVPQPTVSVETSCAPVGRGSRPRASTATPPSPAHLSTPRRDWSPNIGIHPPSVDEYRPAVFVGRNSGKNSASAIVESPTSQLLSQRSMLLL